MTDDPASWPDWRPPTEFPRLGSPVLVTVRDETGREWVDFGARLQGGQWRIGSEWIGGTQVAMESDVMEVVAWMPVPPQPVSIVRCWCGTEGCLMLGEHLESECHTLEMVEAVEEAAARETIKAKSYPTKEVKNQPSDPKGKT